MVAALATTAAATPCPISEPMPEVVAVRVGVSVVVMMPSSGLLARLVAGFSSGLRNGSAPIDRSPGNS
jgi:hypothetical protein